MNSPISLSAHLAKHGASDELRHLILDISRAAKYIQYALRTTEAGLAGTVNLSGDAQVKLDVLSNDIIKEHLMESGLVSMLISEEEEEMVELKGKAPFSVAFDPLDGSSLVDVNFAIGSIFGIYAGAEILGKTPREQVAALYVLYGPRTLLVCSTGDGVHEYILNEIGEFVLLREFLGIGDTAKTFGPGNLAATKENPIYKKLLEEWMESNKTLRYSGCMVSDCHHILSKGQGIFVNLGGGKYPEGKLRMVFECGPFSYLFDQAGGSASDGMMALLDKKLTGLDQRSQIIAGSKGEVERVCKEVGRYRGIEV